MTLALIAGVFLGWIIFVALVVIGFLHLAVKTVDDLSDDEAHGDYPFEPRILTTPPSSALGSTTGSVPGARRAGAVSRAGDPCVHNLHANPDRTEG